MTFQVWRQYRRIWEVGLWTTFFAVQAVANSIGVNIDVARNGLGFAAWEPWVWEVSSAAVLLLLIPFILAVDRRFPIEQPHLWRNLLVHLAFTVPYSLAHVLTMVGLRKLGYIAMGGYYDFGNWPTELFYEYLKDVRVYVYFLAIIYLYRFLLRRWQGEAQFLAQGREESPAEPVTDQFLVKKLGHEFLVKVKDIDWIESAGNYVTLHVGERLYPLRETMVNIERRIGDQGFVRVHRGVIVNLNRICQISTLESGDAKAILADGSELPVSRRYRQVLKQHFREGSNF